MVFKIDIISTMLFLLVFLFLTPIVSADIYKCISDNGVAIFSDEPCGDNSKRIFNTVNQTFDDVIGNGSPYDEQPVDSKKVFKEDFVEHAKKIWRFIMPNTHSYMTKCEAFDGGQGIETYRIDLTDSKKKFNVSMAYCCYYQGDGKHFVFLSSINIIKDKKPFDPSTMVNIKNYRKAGIGVWVYPKE